MINNKIILISIVSFFILIIYSNAFASDSARLYLEGITYYNNGKFEKAVANFEQLSKSGINNEKLYYNLGNAHFKAGNIGNAVLWYERASKIIPNDPDLKFNFNYVKGFLKDKSEEKTSPVFQVLFFWKQLMGQNVIRWTGIILFSIFWFLIIFQMVKGRKLLKLHTGTVFILATVFLTTALYDYYAEKFIKKGIVMPSEISVRSGLTNDSTELFVLHVGTKVFVEEENNNHIKIRFSDDKIGWIEKTSVEII